MDGLKSDKRRIQSGCAEIASLLSEEEPELLYSHIDFFLKSLNADAPVLRWEAACTLGNLARVDNEGNVLNGLDILFSFLHESSIVLQGHSVRALSKIAKNFPEKKKLIFEQLVNAQGNFPGSRIGYVIEAMEVFTGECKERAIKFIKPYTENESKSVVRKAKRALKKLTAY
ncbi:MAG: hypothetical protein GF411_04820 [Candidatus Lokiarchaeota archaeon]|nr:hypothetical protein [Candidatus Lokiarchaeota archaeon]